jgi:transposase-like protein
VQWVYINGSLEWWKRGTRKCIVLPVANRRSDTLLPIIQGNALPGSTIISDEWASYNGIPDLGGGGIYTHQTINHSQNFIHPANAYIHTQSIEALWSRLKRMIRKKQCTSRDLLPTYISEFLWREQHTVNVFSSFVVCICQKYAL